MIHNDNYSIQSVPQITAFYDTINEMKLCQYCISINMWPMNLSFGSINPARRVLCVLRKLFLNMFQIKSRDYDKKHFISCFFKQLFYHN